MCDHCTRVAARTCPPLESSRSWQVLPQLHLTSNGSPVRHDSGWSSLSFVTNPKASRPKAWLMASPIWARKSAPDREEQGLEPGRFTNDAACGIHSVQLCGKGGSCDTAMQQVLSSPSRVLGVERETVPAPAMPNEIMNGTKTIECATELAVEDRVKATLGRRRRRDFKSSTRRHRRNELCIARIGSGAAGEHDSSRRRDRVTTHNGEEMVRLGLKLPIAF